MLFNKSMLKFIIQTRWLYAVALLLGVLQGLSFSFTFNSPVKLLVVVCSVVSLFGFLLIVKDLSTKQAKYFGYLFGIGLFGVGLNWVYISMANFGGAPFIFAILMNIALVAILSLYWLLGAYLITKLGKTTSQRLLLAAPLIALLEWVRSVFLIGFPWLSIGYAWIDSPLSWYSSIGGVFFVSFLVVFFISLLIIVRKRLLLLLLVIGIVCVIALMPSLMPTQKSERTLDVALVQGNMPVITEYNTKRMDKNLWQYKTLTDKLLAQSVKPNLIVWPESAIPYFYQEVDDFFATIHTKQQDEQSPFDLITGIPDVKWKTKQYYNGIVFQRAANRLPQFYYKHHLLAFGEYLPFRGVLAFFKDFVTIPMADFSAGDMIQKGFVSHNITISPSICFEIVFGDEIRQNAVNGQLLLNISNDAWFDSDNASGSPSSKAQIQHLNIARMRAVENQKMLVRSTNNGITAVIDRDGIVLKSLPSYEAGILNATVQAYDIVTPYAYLGDMPFVVLFILLIVGIIVYNCKAYRIVNPL